MKTLASKQVRAEIQALRAAAVSLVLIYHFWPSVLTGGFVGVDVFFAISGFLITTHLLREVDRTGSISVPAFWARRARRILPPALIVVLFCAVATVLFVPLNYWQQFFAEMRASTAYGQNWHLAAAAVDYFSADNPPSPVEHFWSLSAEEQFYIVWPVLIFAAAAAARLRRLRIGRRSIGLAMATLTGVSLAYGVYITAADPAAAYFVTPARAWEFGAGGLLALLPSSSFGEGGRCALSWAGWIAIGIAGVGFTDATPFPGYAALLPVLGAVAVIYAGTPGRRWSPAPLLRLAPVQFLGDISYAVYLWHLPLLVLAPFAIGGGLHTGARITIAMLTILAAWLTKIVIEDPVRSGAFLVRRRARWTFTFAAAGTAAVMAVTFWGASYVQAQVRRDEDRGRRIIDSHPRCFGAAARDPEHPCDNPRLRLMVTPTPVSARNRPNSPCTMVATKPFNVCAFGVPRAKSTGTIALLGDSHASHWRAALEVVAQAKRWHGLSITRSGCPLSRTVKKLRDPLEAACIRWNHDVPRWFAHHPEVSTVFVVQDSGGKWVVPGGQSSFSAEVSGFSSAWKSLPRTVKHVIVIHDTPKDRTDTQACIEHAMAAHRSAGKVCAVPRSVAIDRDSQAVAAARLRSPRVRSVDLNRFFCDSRMCYPVIGGVLVHKDDHHLTVAFATTLGPYLLRDVTRLMAPEPGTRRMVPTRASSTVERRDGPAWTRTRERRIMSSAPCADQRTGRGCLPLRVSG
jgi:peptidoglycan/LPS O-acetylase OafA/YrhL